MKNESIWNTMLRNKKDPWDGNEIIKLIFFLEMLLNT